MKKLVWRLSSLPTVDEVNQLKESGILTVGEARELLLREEEAPKKATPSELDGIKKEVELLRELVLAMSKEKSSITYPIIWHYTQTGDGWNKPYITWASNTTIDQADAYKAGSVTNAYYSYTSAKQIN